MIGDRHLSIDRRLVEIQDEIRSEFGWSLDKDLYVAKWLVNELVCSAPYRRSLLDLNKTWDNIRRELFSHSGSIAIVGAAVEMDEIEDAMKKGVDLLSRMGREKSSLIWKIRKRDGIP